MSFEAKDSVGGCGGIAARVEVGGRGAKGFEGASSTELNLEVENGLLFEVVEEVPKRADPKSCCSCGTGCVGVSSPDCP